MTFASSADTGAAVRWEEGRGAGWLFIWPFGSPQARWGRCVPGSLGSNGAERGCLRGSKPWALPPSIVVLSSAP